jgi:hypothetical protein
MNTLGLVLAFATESDKIVRAAFWTGIVSLAFVVLLIGTVVILRVGSLNQHRRRRRIIKRWRPLLRQAVEGDVPRKLPMLYPGDRLYFLEFWNYLHQTVAPEARERLNVFARKLKLDTISKRLIGSSYLWRQLLGVQTLGNLREHTAWDPLMKFARSDDNVLAVTSARALMQIEPKRAVNELLPVMRDHDDWAETRVASMLTEAGNENICEPLSKAISEAPLPRDKSASIADDAREVNQFVKHQSRLVHFAGATKCPEALESVRTLLRSIADIRASHAPVVTAASNGHTETKVAGAEGTVTSSGYSKLIIACLHVLDRHEDRELIKRFVADHDWHVRLEAADALGRIGATEDQKALTLLLKDEHWWVRYRAAHSLAQLPATTDEHLNAMLAKEQDSAAQDILKHVIAERQLATA